MRELNKKVFFKRKQNSPEHVRELKRQAFIGKKKENPNHTKKINNNRQKKKKKREIRAHNFTSMNFLLVRKLSTGFFNSMKNISAIEDIITAHPADAFIRLQLDLCVSSIIFGYFKNLVTIAPNRLNCKDFTVFTFITRYTYRYGANEQIMSVLLRNKLDSFFPNRPFLGPFLLQGLFSFMHVAWHDIFSLSDHFP